MEKRPPKPLPEARPVERDDTPVQVANALRDSTEATLLAIELSKVLKEQIAKELSATRELTHKSIAALVEKVTATRDIEVEVSARDQNGNLKRLRIISRVSKPVVH